MTQHTSFCFCRIYDSLFKILTLLELLQHPLLFELMINSRLISSFALLALGSLFGRKFASSWSNGFSQKHIIANKLKYKLITSQISKYIPACNATTNAIYLWLFSSCIHYLPLTKNNIGTSLPQYSNVLNVSFVICS